MKSSATLLITTIALGMGSVHAATALIDFAGGNASGSPVANTNTLTSVTPSIGPGSLVDLTGTVISGLSISTSGSMGVHVNGPAAVLTPATVASNTTIGAAFSPYENAFSSSWGPQNAGIDNTYTVRIDGLKAGTNYRLSIIGGRDGGISLPSAMNSSWQLVFGAATFNETASQFEFWDHTANASSSIQETGTGPYSINYNLAIGDVGMSVWEFSVLSNSTLVELTFVNPINAMIISTAQVPEPTVSVLFAVAGLSVLRRRRK